ncbi:hypothetical protein SteCoe_19375 [Stentor coeruleus]|uniref:Uncharacterized protein n=1 Tax=Stentor coeruleus TaxID=5963 RepID=A0A1R2BUL4_9CILI|nr:hypothetical protein SteCoe_19375 [Stentor coeruleus]
MLINSLLLETMWVSSSFCPNYLCSYSPKTNSTCITYYNNSTNDVYSITPCMDGLECNFNNDTNSTCNYPERKYSGDYCFENSDCYSNYCVLNSCYGMNLYNHCTNSGDCNPGLYCDASMNICQELMPPGAPCTYSYQCMNSAECDSGICVTYFSLPLNARTNLVSQTGLWLSCSTGFALNGYCASAPTSMSSSLTQCSLGSLCQSNSGVSYKNCTCSYDGNSYCPLFEGDSQVKQMIQGVQTLITFNYKCNTLSRFSYNCYVKMQQSYFQYFLNWKANADLYLQNEWVNQVNISNCVNQTINADYVNIINQSQGIYPTCPVYSCTNGTSNWNNNQCVFSDKNIVYSQLQSSVYTSYCPYNWTCQAGTPQNFTNGTCTDSASNRYPGEYCNYNSQCTSYLCVNSTCIGKNYTDICYSPYECNPGLYCNMSSICDYVKNNGVYCDNSNKCANGLVCFNNTCIKMYSLYNGLISIVNSTNSTYGYSPVCLSGFYISNYTGTYCDYAPFSWYNSTCNPGNPCFDSSGRYYKNCTCGLYGYGNCPEFEGDYHLQNAINLSSSTMQSWDKCNSFVVRQECFEGSPQEMYNFSLYMTNITYYKDSYWLLYGNENDCVQNTFFSDFWTMMRFINNYIPPSPDCPAYPEYPTYPPYPPYPSNSTDFPAYPDYPHYPEYPMYPENCENRTLPAYPVYPTYPPYPPYP